MSKIISLREKALPITVRLLRWYFRYYLLRKDSPLIVAFQLTNKCNLRCQMCNLWKNPQKNTIPLNTFKRIVDDLSFLGCAYTTLSGGEPFVVDDIFSYLSYVTSKIPYVNLVTNGQLLDVQAARNLGRCKIDMVSISIDGFKETHERIRGMAGSFDKAIEAIENLKHYAPKVKITVNTVISPWNLDELLNFSDLIEQLGVLHKFQPIYHHPVFENQGKEEFNLNVSQDDINKIREIIEKLKNKENVSNSRYYLYAIPDYFASKNNNGLFKENCKSVHFYCEIREDASLFPCLEGMRWKGGFNLSNYNLKEVFNSQEYRKVAKKLSNCKRCQEILPICYVESRIAFPISSYLKYSLMPSLKR